MVVVVVVVDCVVVVVVHGVVVMVHGVMVVVGIDRNRCVAGSGGPRQGDVRGAAVGGVR